MRGNRKQDTGAVDQKRSRSKAAGRPTRNRATLAQQELEQIERLLGEDFESLAQAREALRLETRGRPKVKVVRRRIKKRDEYTLQELGETRSKQLLTLVSKIDENQDQIDALKNENQFFAASVWDRHVEVVFRDASGLSQWLGRYVGVKEWDAALVSSIRIVNYGDPELPFEENMNTRQQELEARRMELKKTNAETDKAHKAAYGKKISGRTESRRELLITATQRIAELEAENKRLKGKQ